MKKSHYIIICAVLLAFFGFIGIFISKKEKRPFEDLKVSDISSVSVHLIPPNKSVRVIDFKELVACLNDIVIYDRDDSYVMYAGQAVTFTITMTDGTETEVMAYNPFLVINGIGYRTEYEPCEKLNNYANGLLASN